MGDTANRPRKMVVPLQAVDQTDSEIVHDRGIPEWWSWTPQSDWCAEAIEEDARFRLSA
jgi:hypothetical protein